MPKTSIEALLTRKLDIRCIDARRLVTEAKVRRMGLMGYASPEQENKILAEALEFFEEQPEEVKISMRSLKKQLDILVIADS